MTEIKITFSKNIEYQYEISVIIPNWNGINYLPECLSSLQKQTFKNYEVIVIDNGSRDNSVNFIKTEYPWIKLIELPENTGFAVACNVGIEAAKGRYVAMLNNDTVVSPEWLESLFTVASSDEKIGMVASKILLNFETREIDSVGMLLYPDGIGRQRGRGEFDMGQFDQDKETLYPSACAALYRMDMLYEIGYFDEDFFAYCEDTDLGLRGRLAGWKAFFAPNAVVLHKYSETGGKYSALKAVQIERNRIWVAVKNFPLKLLFKMPFYVVKRYIIQLYGVLISKGSLAKYAETYSVRDIFPTVFRAYFLAFKGLPLMIKKRRTTKKMLSNKEFELLLRRYKISARELALRN